MSKKSLFNFSSNSRVFEKDKIYSDELIVGIDPSKFIDTKDIPAPVKLPEKEITKPELDSQI